MDFVFTLIQYFENKISGPCLKPLNFNFDFKILKMQFKNPGATLKLSV